MIIEISVAIIALAFAGLVIYLITVLRTTQLILKHVDQTFIHVRTQLGSLNPVLKAVENVGEVLEKKSASLKEEVNSIENVESLSQKNSLHSSATETINISEENRLADFFQLLSVSIRLWQKLKKRR